MVKNFFDLVSDGFFNPFTNSNKRYNYDLLQLINNKMSLDNLQVTKDVLVDWIVDYIENCPIDLFNDETNDLEKDVKSFAYDKVRYFVKCGWLIEDFEGIRITYQLDENGIKLLGVMDNAIKDDTKSLEFSGYVYNIYNNLYNFNYDHSVDIVEQVYMASQELNRMLRGLNVNIKKFLTKLISENKAMPKEILETIFYDYQKKVVLKAFKNFREKDNPSKYKLYIEDKIDSLMNVEKMSLMVNNYVKVKCDNSNAIENQLVAEEFFISKLTYIKDQFEDIEDYIKILDKRNTKYISTAQSRLNFLLNEETNVEGRIIECLKGIAKMDDIFFEDGYFELYKCVNLDEYSLYKPVSKKAKPKSEPLVENDNSIEDIEKLTEELFKNNIYSESEINKYVIDILKDNYSIYASDIFVNDFSDVLKIFLIQIYSENKNVCYKIIPLEQSYKLLDYKMNDFIIERKTL